MTTFRSGDVFPNVANAITEEAQVDGSLTFVTKWLVVAECVGNDGEKYLMRLVPDGVALWDQLGMLEHSLTDLRSHVSGGLDDE